MIPEPIHNNNSTGASAEPWIIWAMGPGLGALFGWLIVPSEFSPIGLIGGAGIGGLLVVGWILFVRKKSKSIDSGTTLNWVGKLLYLFFICICLYFLWLSLKVWEQDSGSSLIGLVGIIFAGIGLIIFILAWLHDSFPQQDQRSEGLVFLGIGLSFCLLALTFLFLVPMGSPLVGVLCALFFGFCGLRIVQKGRVKLQRNNFR